MGRHRQPRTEHDDLTVAVWISIVSGLAMVAVAFGVHYARLTATESVVPAPTHTVTTPVAPAPSQAVSGPGVNKLHATATRTVRHPVILHRQTVSKAIHSHRQHHNHHHKHRHCHQHRHHHHGWRG